MANPTLTGLLYDIADAIRETNGTSGRIPALEFPDAIRSNSGGGAGGGSGGGSTFGASASGRIPDYDHGYATAELTDVLTTSVVGVIE